MMLMLVLALCSLLTGLMAGFLLAMSSVVQSMLDDLDGPGYTSVMQSIIVHGRASIAVKVLLLTPIVLALIALILAVIDQQIITAAFTVIALVIWLAGPLMISRQRAEPLYDRIMSWRDNTPPDDWTQYRTGWQQINRLRTATALFACIIFSFATYLTTL